MPSYIALLRGINVGGRNRVPMAELRAMAKSLGLAGVQTVLQSGNLVFEAEARAPAAWEKQLEKATQEHFDLALDYCVRSGAEWARIVEENPFSSEAAQDPAHVVVMCLKSAARAEQAKTLREALKGPERIEVRGRELYAVYPAGIGTSKLTNAVIERSLGIRGTARNWNTALRVRHLVGA